METQYSIKVTVDPVTVTYNFQTEGEIDPVDIAAGLGKAFAMDIFHSTVVQPAALADMLGGLGVNAYLLIGVIDADPVGQKMKFIGAIGDLAEGADPTLQDMALPTLRIPASADLSQNPLFSMGPFDFPISIEGYQVTIKDVTLTGIFEHDYNYSGKGEFQGDLDLGPVAGLVGMDPATLCAVVGGCNPCPGDAGRVECVHLYIKNIRSDQTTPLIPIAAVTGEDLGGTATQHNVELTLLEPTTGAVQPGVDIKVTLTAGDGNLAGSTVTTVTTDGSGKATVVVTDLNGGSDVLTLDITSGVPYLWVTGTATGKF
jgi:hypothetical protein